MTVFYDRATISGKARITREGYFVADALVARANNIQDYRAGELGLTDRPAGDVVRVFRPEAEVFAVDSLKSASRLPITLDHPREMVDAGNWREFAKGETGEEILRDGEFLRVPLRIMDAGAVHSVQHDRQEFSLGYAANIELRGGFHDGKEYDAVATQIRYNHLAAVPTARGGPELRITDERTVGAQPVTHRIIDGFSVNLSDAVAVAAAVDKLIADRDAAVTDLGAARNDVVARDAQAVTDAATIADLTGKLAAAQLTPAQMQDAAAAYGRTIADAKRLGATIADGATAIDAQRAALAVKMGDKAANYSDEHVAIAFDTLVSALPTDGKGPDPLAAVLGDAANITDAQAEYDAARAARFIRLETGHRGAVVEA